MVGQSDGILMIAFEVLDMKVDVNEQHIAIIGAGVSGIAAAKTWKQCGYRVTVYEASDAPGGHWAQAYPGVTLQNTAPQYQFSDYPWPFKPDRHPTGEQIMRYLDMAVAHYDLDIRYNHTLSQMERLADGWHLVFADRESIECAYVVIATGQYPAGGQKLIPNFAGMDQYKGKVKTSIGSLDEFDGHDVAVIGFGKTALDFTSWSAERAASTTHVFRTPRWTIPDHLLGIDFTRAFFARFGSDMMPSWCYSSKPQAFLHNRLSGVVRGFWSFIATLFQYQHRRNAKLGSIDASVLDPVMPPKPQFVPDLRSATALAPGRYYEHVAHGRITPKQEAVASFNEDGVVLANGETVAADLVMVCCGSETPVFDYLPEPYRSCLSSQDGGPVLYRHLIDPRVPDVGFAGYNHGFLHIALCEVGSLWQIAAHRGDLTLPTEAEMSISARRVTAWKDEHCSYEPTRNMAVSTRYQQHLDILMRDLGLSQWRKLPNLPAEIFARYDPTDYNGIADQFLAESAKRRAEGKTQTVWPADA